MSNLRWLELRQRVQRLGRPLTCPICKFRFSFRHLVRAGKACPQCKVPLGYSSRYRLVLAIAGLCTAAWVMYIGYQGEAAAGWLIVGPAFAAAAGIAVQVAIQRIFPPKVEAHAEGNTWLKLT